MYAKEMKGKIKIKQRVYGTPLVRRNKFNQVVKKYNENK
jgi:hypothetical protein